MIEAVQKQVVESNTKVNRSVFEIRANRYLSLVLISGFLFFLVLFIQKYDLRSEQAKIDQQIETINQILDEYESRNVLLKGKDNAEG